MIKIDSPSINWYSPLDEKSFYEWAMEIPCVTSIEGGFLHVKSKRVSESDLRDLIAIMFRYHLPMAQLQQFCNPRNERWFKAKHMFWYEAVFGEQST